MVGKTIVVNRHPLEIVGVVQDGFEGLDLAYPAQVYVPIVMQPQMGPAWLRLDDRRFRFVQAFARLRDGVNADQALAALQPLYRSLLEQEATGGGVLERVGRDEAPVPRGQAHAWTMRRADTRVFGRRSPNRC